MDSIPNSKCDPKERKKKKKKQTLSDRNNSGHKNWKLPSLMCVQLAHATSRYGNTMMIAVSHSMLLNQTKTNTTATA